MNGPAPLRRDDGEWLPPDKTAAICFSVDDIHPGTSRDAYEAGGDLASGALGRLADLLRRHPSLKVTLGVTPDWRLKSLVPDAHFLRRIPGLSHVVPWSQRHASGHFRIDRYPGLVTYLNGLERCEAVLHGYRHAAEGEHLAMEFQRQTTAQCAALVQRGIDVFEAAQLRYVKGFIPPAWNAPPSLLAALHSLGFEFLCSARDLRTEVKPSARTAMSGMHGVSLIYPQFVGRSNVVHLTCNFQATSRIERAMAILNEGGVLHIKAHIFKSGGGHTMVDGLDELYCNYLDVLFELLERQFGDALWWAHLSEVAARVRRCRVEVAAAGIPA